jgi:hypothetical protein
LAAGDLGGRLRRGVRGRPWGRDTGSWLSQAAAAVVGRGSERSEERECRVGEREVGEGRSNGGGHREQGGRARRLGEKVVREIE